HILQGLLIGILAWEWRFAFPRGTSTRAISESPALIESAGRESAIRSLVARSPQPRCGYFGGGPRPGFRHKARGTARASAVPLEAKMRSRLGYPAGDGETQPSLESALAGKSFPARRTSARSPPSARAR